MLIDTRGNVVYNVNKGPALGTNILTGPYRGSNLRGAYEKAMNADSVDFVWITDFQPFQAAGGVPIAWLVSPIGSPGKTDWGDGASAADFESQPHHDRRPTMESRGHGRHRRDVPGRPGRVDAFGLSAVPARSRRISTRRGGGGHARGYCRQGNALAWHDVGAARRRPKAFRLAQRGQTGTITDTGYLGDQELAAYAPVAIPNSDLRWSILATRDSEEAYARIAAFARTLVVTAAVLVFVLCVLAMLIAQRFVGPSGDCGPAPRRSAPATTTSSIPVTTRDEIGHLTALSTR